MDLTQIVIAILALMGTISGAIGTYLATRRKSDIDYLHLQHKALSDDNDKLRERVSESEKTNNDLREKMIELKAKLTEQEAELKAKLAQQEIEIEALKRDNNTLNNRTIKQQGEISRQQEEIIQLKVENAHLLNRLSQMEQENYDLRNGKKRM